MIRKQNRIDELNDPWLCTVRLALRSVRLALACRFARVGDLATAARFVKRVR